MQVIQYKPIGVIHTPFHDTKNMPIQPASAIGIQGTVDVAQEYNDGLKDIEGFSHIFLIYHFHLSKGYSLTVKPFLDDHVRGVFSTRAPKRPNQIGISVVRLDRIEGSTLFVFNVDMVDGTPLLDIKPFVPDFDSRTDIRIGWLTGKVEEVAFKKSDSRFGSVKE
ncbi:MAG: tRNA (N6-threonylcarbamoyladenosine(37)-N6)-methyltransferase TrmO [Thermodesulfobacteriota bacterium]|nr:tRNA (N6-threonylcarbamoyladenosine(37)-N6)-methyltransferase TrmO [Thermodesulfobacteriota bacterium]